MSKINPLYKKWDVKYFYNLHVERQKLMWETPTSYPAFENRLRKWMVLKEAIYKPCKTNMRRNKIQMPKPKPVRNWWYRFINLFR